MASVKRCVLRAGVVEYTIPTRPISRLTARLDAKIYQVLRESHSDGKEPPSSPQPVAQPVVQPVAPSSPNGKDPHPAKKRRLCPASPSATIAPHCSTSSTHHPSGIPISSDVSDLPPLQVVVVGAGAAGIELAMATQRRVEQRTKRRSCVYAPSSPRVCTPWPPTRSHACAASSHASHTHAHAP